MPPGVNIGVKDVWYDVYRLIDTQFHRFPRIFLKGLKIYSGLFSVDVAPFETLRSSHYQGALLEHGHHFVGKGKLCHCQVLVNPALDKAPRLAIYGFYLAEKEAHEVDIVGAMVEEIPTPGPLIEISPYTRQLVVSSSVVARGFSQMM